MKPHKANKVEHKKPEQLSLFEVHANTKVRLWFLGDPHDNGTAVQLPNTELNRIHIGHRNVC